MKACGQRLKGIGMKQKCPVCNGCASSRTIGAGRYIYCEFCDKYFSVEIGGYTEVPEIEIVKRIREDATDDGKTKNDLH